MPNQYRAEGGCSRLIGASACGSTVPSQRREDRDQRPSAAAGCAADDDRSDGGGTQPQKPLPRSATRTRRRRSAVPATAVVDGRAALNTGSADRTACSDRSTTQVDQHVDAAEKIRIDALDDRVVAAQDRVDRQPAEAGMREHASR